MNFAERLKQLRLTKHIGQKEIAGHFGMTPRAWRFYESGKREPNISLLIAIADYFNVSIDYLVGRKNYF